MTQEANKQKRRSIIELSCDEAREFFLKQESYFTTDLPSYYQFNDLLSNVAKVLENKRFSDLHKRPQYFDGVNYTILNNKDGRYAWRPLELIHPALYVSLVNEITKPDQWKLICDRFHDFSSNPKIKCLSLPVESLTDEKDKAEQIIQWWQDVEQKSIELSLDYDFVFQTDLTDCYADIYTHSIAWALHTKQTAKDKDKRKDLSLIGNIIDTHIQDMHQGQTNGIPQGPVLMDFIGEMVLGYADAELTSKLESMQDLKDYRILRYRDDYRIFVNSPQDGERILKSLTEVMIDLGLKLNPSKTDISSDVIRASIKEDKFDWMFRRQSAGDLQRRLLIIRDHSMKHPNSGSLERALRDYYKRLIKSKKYTFPFPLISIVVDIAYRNPRTYAISAAILSKLIDMLEITPEEKKNIIKRIRRKFYHLPNTGYMQLWLQRISLQFASDIEFDEPLCQLVSQGNGQIWNNDWISYKDLRNAVDSNAIIDRDKISDITPVIPIEEVETFVSNYE